MPNVKGNVRWPLCWPSRRASLLETKLAQKFSVAESITVYSFLLKLTLAAYTTGVDVLGTYISPYLLFFFSTIRSQMSSTCSVFKSCTSWPRILFSSTLGNKRHPSSSGLLMQGTRLSASLAPYQRSSTVLHTLTTWSLSCLANSVTLLKWLKYSTILQVCRSSYTYIHR